VEDAYLYLMYWSGADVLDVCRDPHPSDTVAHLEGRPDMYLVSERPLPLATMAQLPIGKLYSLGGAPLGIWGAAAVGTCPLR
jgi:hypothetical protein